MRVGLHSKSDTHLQTLLLFDYRLNNVLDHHIQNIAEVTTLSRSSGSFTLGCNDSDQAPKTDSNFLLIVGPSNIQN